MPDSLHGTRHHRASAQQQTEVAADEAAHARAPEGAREDAKSSYADHRN